MDVSKLKSLLGLDAKITSVTVTKTMRALFWEEQHRDSGEIETRIANTRTAIASGISIEDAIYFGLSDLSEEEAYLAVVAASLLEKWFPGRTE